MSEELKILTSRIAELSFGSGSIKNSGILLRKRVITIPIRPLLKYRFGDIAGVRDCGNMWGWEITIKPQVM